MIRKAERVGPLRAHDADGLPRDATTAKLAAQLLARWSIREDEVELVLREPLEGSDSWLLRGRLEAQYGRPDVYAAQKIQLGKRALARLLPEGMR